MTVAVQDADSRLTDNSVIPLVIIDTVNKFYRKNGKHPKFAIERNWQLFYMIAL